MAHDAANTLYVDPTDHTVYRVVVIPASVAGTTQVRYMEHDSHGDHPRALNQLPAGCVKIWDPSAQVSLF
jgi:hypothetical protein